MPTLFVGYDVAANGRRRQVRRSIERYVPALQKSALYGGVLPHDVRQALVDACTFLEPTEDGLLLARLLTERGQVKGYHLKPSNVSTAGLLIVD